MPDFTANPSASISTQTEVRADGTLVGYVDRVTGAVLLTLCPTCWTPTSPISGSAGVCSDPLCAADHHADLAAFYQEGCDEPA